MEVIKLKIIEKIFDENMLIEHNESYDNLTINIEENPNFLSVISTYLLQLFFDCNDKSLLYYFNNIKNYKQISNDHYMIEFKTNQTLDKSAIKTSVNTNNYYLNSYEFIKN